MSSSKFIILFLVTLLLLLYYVYYTNYTLEQNIPIISSNALDPLPPLDPWSAWPPLLSHSICRPKIYVYPVPENLRIPKSDYFGICYESNYKSEIILWEQLLSGRIHDHYVTQNPEEADYYYIPFLGSCWLFSQCWQHHHFNFSERCNVDERYVLPMMQYVIEAYPYWNRSGGTDHIMVHPMDHSYTYYESNSVFQPAIFLTTIGDKRQNNFYKIRYSKDIVIPSATSLIHYAGYNPRDYLDEEGYPVNLFGNRVQRNIFAIFRGGGSDIKPDDAYSQGIRYLLFHGFKDYPGWNIGNSEWDMFYARQLSRSRFGITPAGWTLDTTRLWEYLAFGVVPVIIADGIIQPFENDVDWHGFSVYVRREDAHQLDKILRSITEEEYERKRKRVWEEGARVGLERDAWHFIARQLCRLKRITRNETLTL
ncbi:uncharacterized protein VTP21DRAFT_8223 [Calcarisporiella thermophila]|uniref:uncharacterized protein n=1 Tax=Calcarisporiella thermophila TaxID=911321 RepID=UPI003742BDD9